MKTLALFAAAATTALLLAGPAQADPACGTDQTSVDGEHKHGYKDKQKHWFWGYHDKHRVTDKAGAHDHDYVNCENAVGEINIINADQQQEIDFNTEWNYEQDARLDVLDRQVDRLDRRIDKLNDRVDEVGAITLALDNPGVDGATEGSFSLYGASATMNGKVGFGLGLNYNVFDNFRVYGGGGTDVQANNYAGKVGATWTFR